MSKRPRLSVSPGHEYEEDDTGESDSSDSFLSVSSSDSIAKKDGSESSSSSSRTDSDSASSGADTDDSSYAESEDHAKPNSGRFQCSDCGKCLASSSALLRHGRSHDGIKPYSCTWPDCGYRTANGSNILRHIRVVHFKVPATRKGQLEQNGAVETRKESDFIHRDDQILGSTLTKRQHEAESESKSVKGKSAKRKAPRKHLPCYFTQLGLCNRFFSSKQNRRVHYRIHLSIRPYFCAYPHCTDNYRAEERSAVLWHIRTVHLGLPGKASKQKALGGKESPDAKAYLAVDKELLNPEIEQNIEIDN